MPGVNPVQKKPGLMQTLLPIAGQAVGSAFGGPVGGAVGGQVGGMLAQGKAPQAPVESSAISRRIDTYQAPPAQGDGLDQLDAAHNALAQMPPEVQQQYGPTIAQARQQAMRNRGVV